MKRIFLVFFLSLVLVSGLSAVPIAAYIECEVHGFDYHAYDGRLIDYVGNDTFMDWIKTHDILRAGDCPFSGSIRQFLQDFKIPRSVAESIYYAPSEYYFSDYPVDLLYEGDETAVDIYYRDWRSREDHRTLLSNMGEIRWRMVNYTRDSADPAMQAFHQYILPDHQYLEWSIADFVRITGIEKEALQTLMTEMATLREGHVTGFLPCFAWDYDLLYEIAAEPVKTTAAEKLNEDLRFLGLPEVTATAAPQTDDPVWLYSALTAASTMGILYTQKRRFFG